MKKNNHPFSCPVCEKYPKEKFKIFEPTEDYLLIIPEEKLIHIHFGNVPEDESVNIDKAEFMAKTLLGWAKEYPQTDFFLVVDFERTKGSYTPPEAMSHYIEILKNPQLNQGVIYGPVPDLLKLLKPLLLITKVNARIVETQEEASEEAKKWKMKNGL